MTQSVESALQAALSGLSLRQQVVANNIANADTPGFRARLVRFEDKLTTALRAGPDTLRSADTAPVVQVAPGEPTKLDGNTVDLDQQLLSMTDTNLRYNAVARMLSERLALYSSIITDGKG